MKNEKTGGEAKSFLLKPIRSFSRFLTLDYSKETFLVWVQFKK
jgi:hypothetical protein